MPLIDITSTDNTAGTATALTFTVRDNDAGISVVGIGDTGNGDDGSGSGGGPSLPAYDPTGAHKFWRLLISTTWSSPSRCVVGEIVFLDASGNPIASGMFDGWPISYIGFDFAQDQSKAFDGNPSTSWNTPRTDIGPTGVSADVGYHFNTAATVNGVTLTPYGGYTSYFPRHVEVQSSDDGATWGTLWSFDTVQPAYPGDNTPHTYTRPSLGLG